MRWAAAVICSVLLLQGAQADVYRAFQAMQSYTSQALDYMRSDGMPQAYAAPAAGNYSSTMAQRSPAPAPDSRPVSTRPASPDTAAINATSQTPLFSRMPGNLSSFASVQAQSGSPAYSSQGVPPTLKPMTCLCAL